MAKIGSQVEGLGECLANMKIYEKALKQATPTSLKQAGLFLQRESQIETPRLTSNLVNSAFTRMNGSEEVNVGYQAEYSVYVHENLLVNHNNGKAKFLTDPMQDKASEITKILANDLKKVKPPRTT